VTKGCHWLGYLAVMEFIENMEVLDLLNTYPEGAKKKLLELRTLVINTAEKLNVPKLLETTKWGEASYVAKGGSTIRMDWKSKTPGKCYLFFICSTQLVSTFRFVFDDQLKFEGDRAIVLDLNETLPSKELTKCIEAALTYQKVKKQHLLGF